MEPRCYCQSRVDTCDSLDNNVDINLKLVNPAVPKITIIRGEIVVVGLGLKPWSLGTKIDNSRTLATARHILQNMTETTLPPFMPNSSSAKRLYVSKLARNTLSALQHQDSVANFLDSILDNKPSQASPNISSTCETHHTHAYLLALTSAAR